MKRTSYPIEVGDRVKLTVVGEVLFKNRKPTTKPTGLVIGRKDARFIVLFDGKVSPDDCPSEAIEAETPVVKVTPVQWTTGRLPRPDETDRSNGVFVIYDGSGAVRYASALTVGYKDLWCTPPSPVTPQLA